MEIMPIVDAVEGMLPYIGDCSVALEESNNIYIETYKSIHQIETDIEQTTGQSIETIQLTLHAEKPK